jgi:ribosomal protein S18 acetylase RimI-like enzyme
MAADDVPGPVIRRLTAADLASFKSLRDEGLARHEDAFAVDVETERAFSPESYLPRLGLAEPLGGTFLLGAFIDGQLAGGLSLERAALRKLRHTATLSTMVVRPAHAGRGIGRALLAACLAEARHAPGLELIQLSVSTSSAAAVRLYERAGFERWGLLPHALRIGEGPQARYFDKLYMVYRLHPRVA